MALRLEDLDYGSVTAHPAKIRLPGSTKLRFTASIIGGGQVKIRYFIKKADPMAFVMPSGKLSKVAWKMPVQLSSDLDDPTLIEKELHLVKDPEDDPQRIVELYIQIAIGSGGEGQFVPIIDDLSHFIQILR